MVCVISGVYIYWYIKQQHNIRIEHRKNKIPLSIIVHLPPSFYLRKRNFQIDSKKNYAKKICPLDIFHCISFQLIENVKTTNDFIPFYIIRKKMIFFIQWGVTLRFAKNLPFSNTCWSNILRGAAFLIDSIYIYRKKKFVSFFVEINLFNYWTKLKILMLLTCVFTVCLNLFNLHSIIDEI